MSAKDSYQRPKKEEYAAALRMQHVCDETQRATARHTIKACAASPRAKEPGTFAHEVLRLVVEAGADPKWV